MGADRRTRSDLDRRPHPLAADTGLTALFSIPDGAFVRCVAAVIGAQGPIRTSTPVGELYPAHAGATARAYFAFVDAAVRRDVLYALPLGRYSELTAVDQAQVETLFDETAARGYAISFGEWDPRSRAAAAPVFLGQRVVGSLSIGGLNNDPVTGELPQRDLEKFLERLLAAATELGALLASRTAPPRSDWRRGRSSR